MGVVRVEMQVAGIANVRNGLRTVKDIVAQAEQSASKEAAKSAQRREKIQASLSKERIRMEGQVSKEIIRLSGTEAKAAASLAKEKLRIADKGARDRVKAEEQANKAIQKSADQTAKYLAGVQLSSARNAGRLAAKQASDEARVATQRARALGSDRRGYLGAAGRGVGNVAGMALKLGGAAAALGGGFTIADVVQKSLGNEKAAVALSNSAFQGKAGEKRLDPRELLKTVGKVQGATGVDKGELLKGLQDYVALSGDSKLLSDEKSIGRFAKLAKGSGADVGEILQSAASLASQNADLTPEQQADMLRNVVGQGKLGAVELPDLARVAGRVAASSTMYGTGAGNNQGDNQRKLLALTQIARKTSGSADDAATAVSRFGNDVAKHAKANGLEDTVFSDKKTGKLKDPAEILAAYFEKTGGNIVKMGEGKGNLGLGVESAKIAQAVSGDYEKAKNEALKNGASAKDANKAGADAVRKKVQQFEGAKYSEDDVQNDFKAVMATQAERMNASFQKISDVLETRAAPFIEKLATSLENNGPKIEKVLTGIADAAETLMEHPFAGLAAIVGASIAKEIAAAKIAQLIKNAFTGGSGGGVPGAPGGAGAGAGAGAGGGGMGRVGGLVAAGAVGYAAGSIASDVMYGALGDDGSTDSIGKTDALVNRTNDWASRRYDAIAKGEKLSLSPDEAAAAAKTYSGAMSLGEDANQKRSEYGGWSKFTDTIGATDHSGEIDRQAKAAMAALDQVRKLDAESGGQVSKSVAQKKLDGKDLIDADAVKTAISGAVTAGVKAASGDKPMDPSAGNRNTPQVARPPA